MPSWRDIVVGRAKSAAATTTTTVPVSEGAATAEEDASSVAAWDGSQCSTAPPPSGVPAVPSSRPPHGDWTVKRSPAMEWHARVDAEPASPLVDTLASATSSVLHLGPAVDIDWDTPGSHDVAAAAAEPVDDAAHDAWPAQDVQVEEEEVEEEEAEGRSAPVEVTGWGDAGAGDAWGVASPAPPPPPLRFSWASVARKNIPPPPAARKQPPATDAAPASRSSSTLPEEAVPDSGMASEAASESDLTLLPDDLSTKKYGSMRDWMHAYTLSARRTPTLPRGLYNGGQQCFMITTLQTLLHCPPFLHLLASIAKDVHFSFNSQSHTLNMLYAASPVSLRANHGEQGSTLHASSCPASTTGRQRGTGERSRCTPRPSSTACEPCAASSPSRGGRRTRKSL